jgi:hypothetical protein
MSFYIFATNKYGPIKLLRLTAREAFDLAATYRQKGFEGVRVTNVETGETISEHELTAENLRTEPEQTPKLRRDP